MQKRKIMRVITVNHYLIRDWYVFFDVCSGSSTSHSIFLSQIRVGTTAITSSITEARNFTTATAIVKDVKAIDMDMNTGSDGPFMNRLIRLVIWSFLLGIIRRFFTSV